MTEQINSESRDWGAIWKTDTKNRQKSKAITRAPTDQIPRLARLTNSFPIAFIPFLPFLEDKSKEVWLLVTDVLEREAASIQVHVQ